VGASKVPKRWHAMNKIVVEREEQHDITPIRNFSQIVLLLSGPKLRSEPEPM